MIPFAKELRQRKHPGEEAAKKESKKRKRLNFDEVSNIILEGVGEGPLRTGRALEEAAAVGNIIPYDPVL